VKKRKKRSIAEMIRKRISGSGTVQGQAQALYPGGNGISQECPFQRPHSVGVSDFSLHPRSVPDFILVPPIFLLDGS